MDTHYKFWVYILSSKGRRLYVGMTNSLLRRVMQHKSGDVDSSRSDTGLTALGYDFIKCVHPQDCHTKVLGMIQGYLDESGIHDGAKICLVGGYFGGTGQWKKFGSAWKVILTEYNVPEFHAHEFYKRDGADRSGVYRGWSDTKAGSFLNKLVAVITGHEKIHPVSAALVVDCFNQLSHNQRKFLTGGTLLHGKFKGSGCPSKPYFLPFQLCIRVVADHAPIGGKAHFAFDLNKQFKGYAVDLFDIVKSEQRLSVHDRIGDVTFPTGLEAVQLQAADFLCYESYKYAHKRVLDVYSKPHDLLASMLKNKVQLEDFPFLDDHGLSLLLKDVEIPPD